MPRTVLLIDGNSLTYRAFFALPTDLATASGQVTNAVFGFTSMLINIIRDHPHDGIAVALDRPEPTFRHERIPTYKGNRDSAPDILRQQMGLVRQVIESLGIPIFEVVGVEADDVIATLATQGRDAGDDVIVVTGDRDSYQLVEDPHIKVLYNKRGVSDYALYDEAGIARAHRRPAHPLPAVRRAPWRPLRQPAGRSRGGGEDGRQADHHLRRDRRHLRAPRRRRRRSSGRTSAPTRRTCARTTR